MDKLAILIGKASFQTIRLMDLGMGSNVPGRIARAISPAILHRLALQCRHGVIAITGTNGKSTTSGLLASILKQADFKLVHNREGANLVTGITASLVEAASFDGIIDADYGLLEIDEAALPVVAKEVKLKSVTVTNLFRDQLDRFGELDTTARLITKGIAQNQSKGVLNADDPNVSQLNIDGDSFFYGIDGFRDDQTQLQELAYCANCGKEIIYDAITYGQLGNWRCSTCNHRRPKLDFFASDIELSPAFSTFNINAGSQSVPIKLDLPGLFNIYNAVAAGATAFTLGVTLQTIKEGLSQYTTLFGRSETLTINGRKVFIQLIKNPAGATQTVKALSQNQKDITVLIAINDNLADGRDISWLWDAEFELLAYLDCDFLVSGQRGEDMAIRLKYAGVRTERIRCVPDLREAVQQALEQTKLDATLWILPTYTCLLQLQKIFKSV
jgi:lipid II isoglutaminyl synthase (glutamine-hydrolysing)